jgi:hypothetical protein
MLYCNIKVCMFNNMMLIDFMMFLIRYAFWTAMSKHRNIESYHYLCPNFKHSATKLMQADLRANNMHKIIENTSVFFLLPTQRMSDYTYSFLRRRQSQFGIRFTSTEKTYPISM